MGNIQNYRHNVASHCESGSVRNLLKHSGMDISEPTLFSIGSGLAFAYMVNQKGVGGFPVTAARLPMGSIVKNVQKSLKVDFFNKNFKTTEDAIKFADELLAKDIPAAICVDMYYMTYLPKFMQVHAPFHFVVLVGKEGDYYYISDPYYQEIGKLHIDMLKSAWETRAKFAKDNLIVYVKDIPKEIDWRPVIKKTLLRSCDNILIAPVIGDMLKIFGYRGIELFAKDILTWPDKYRGLKFREGMLFTPTILEEQGTGGGAFRFLFGAFLKEAADKLNNPELAEYAKKINIIGEEWRDASRNMIKTAKEIPVDNKLYDDWFYANEKQFREKIAEVSNLFDKIALREKEFFTKLKRLANFL
ncbi:MAG: BtrH N-terminal domain-containing protein [Spirochaetes bacterium]|nr:BtrH N-terminal domain-containing protein [Spirochaetota bacterium]